MRLRVFAMLGLLALLAGCRGGDSTGASLPDPQTRIVGVSQSNVMDVFDVAIRQLGSVRNRGAEFDHSIARREPNRIVMLMKNRGFGGADDLLGYFEFEQSRNDTLVTLRFNVLQSGSREVPIRDAAGWFVDNLFSWGQRYIDAVAGAIERARVAQAGGTQPIAATSASLYGVPAPEAPFDILPVRPPARDAAERLYVQGKIAEARAAILVLANAGEPSALRPAAMALYQGVGGPTDVPAADVLLRKAIAAGDRVAEAYGHLARRLDLQNPARGLEILREEARKGNSDALGMLGEYAEAGIGTARSDIERAARLYAAAAALGGLIAESKFAALRPRLSPEQAADVNEYADKWRRNARR